jgi:hypothetical protein
MKFRANPDKKKGEHHAAPGIDLKRGFVDESQADKRTSH